MSYEIHLLAINQKTPVHINLPSRVLLHNEIEHYEVNRYFEIWPFFSNTKGILYSLTEEIQEDFFGAFKLCDSDFEVTVPENLFPSWISSEAKEDMTPFIINEDVYEDVVRIIEYVLINAPQRRILFQTRYQCEDNEIVFGVIKFNKFKDMLVQRQILFNTCYILELD